MQNIFDIDEINSSFNFDSALSYAKKNNVKEVIVVSSYNEFLFDAETLKKLKVFERKLKASGIDLIFSACLNKIKFSLDEIVTANKKLDFLEDVITGATIQEGRNERKLSPLERYILIYNFCTQFKYKTSEGNYYTSRTLVGILNTDEIVCVGYAELLSELCKRCGILCIEQGVFLAIDEKELENVKEEINSTNHSTNLIYIKDKKYHYDQVIYSDSCNDAPSDKAKRNSTKYVFVPLLRAGDFSCGKVYKGNQMLPAHIKEIRKKFDKRQEVTGFNMSSCLDEFAKDLTLCYITTSEEREMTEKVLNCCDERDLGNETMVRVCNSLKNAKFNNLPILALVNKKFIDNGDYLIEKSSNPKKTGMNALLERVLGGL